MTEHDPRCRLPLPHDRAACLEWARGRVAANRADALARRAPNVGELFAGYGGLGMGVQLALGGRLEWVSDLIHTESGKLTGPARILAHRFPDVPNLGDVTAVDWTAVPRVDILTGGSPCQDISNAGRLAGMADGTRSNLWVAMRTAIDELEPSLVVWENVGGALNAGATSDVEPCEGCVGASAGVHMRALGRVLGDLAALGFDAEWVCVRAADAGAPHGRLRVFVLAWPTTAHPEGIGWTAWRSRPDQAETAAIAPRRPSVPVGPSAGLPLFGTPRASDYKGCGPKGSKAHQHRLDRSYLDAQVVELPDDSWGPYAAAVARWEYLTRPAPAHVETGPTGGRRLAAPFVEWMMGLPKGWVTDVPDITRADSLRALGNGVVPQQAALAIETVRGRLLD